MFATYNSSQSLQDHTSCQHRHTILVSALLWCVLLQPLFAQTNVIADKQSLVAHAEKAYVAAHARFQAEPTNSEAAWMFGRACFERAEFATNDTQRATLAVEGINAMRSLAALEPNSAPAHYYLGMNLGQLARTKTLGALKLVDEMEHEFKLARELDEKFSYAGSDRNLGLLYLKAPGWPASIGSRTKARRHLERAVELAPGSPENRLNLIEACLKWGDRTGARRELKSLEALWPAARTNFVGEAWASSWADWESRLRELKGKVKESTPAPGRH